MNTRFVYVFNTQTLRFENSKREPSNLMPAHVNHRRLIQTLEPAAELDSWQADPLMRALPAQPASSGLSIGSRLDTTSARLRRAQYV